MKKYDLAIKTYKEAIKWADNDQQKKIYQNKINSSISAKNRLNGFKPRSKFDNITLCNIESILYFYLLLSIIIYNRTTNIMVLS